MGIPGQECATKFGKKFAKKIGSLYSEDYLDQVAKKTGFKQRSSKLTPKMFVDTILFKELSSGKMSLNDHCISIKKEYGINIKKQSLDERLGDEAVSFVKQLLREQLSDQVHGVLQDEKLTDLLQHFSSVNIKDSTRYQVSSNLKEHYPGPSGAASGAGVHIQFEFDLKSGVVNDLNVTDALRQDTTDAKNTIDKIEKNSLILRDLGYFSTTVLEEIARREAYYITRPSTLLTIYGAKDQKQIIFSNLLRVMKRKKLPWMELNVLLGKKRLPARLLVEKIPPTCFERRLARMKDNSRRKGFQYSQEYRAQQELNIFVTNIPSDLVPAEELRKLYHLRWQIELRFKAWKSYYHLDKIKKMQRHRFECYLYSTLLLIMINWEIAINFFSIIWNHTDHSLSILKFYKTTAIQLKDLRAAILKGKQRLTEYISLLYEISLESLLSEKKKGQNGLHEILKQK